MFKIELSATSIPLGKVCMRCSLGDGTSGLLSERLIARGAESGSERWEWEEQSKSAINRPAPSMLITFEIPPYGAGLTTISGLTIDRLVIAD
ncbi:hypothetical protein CROQUDRAFT_87660 [Cronartium quercuum f. sp. fusiforme G11]|uniref:Uncharacterized protein n=1 Tax=Cronartium quercuum f. sp. fusiforme G11 TaxID=708437 RepID=A0A9P6NSI3_9BASI|nr:hypothetical protein CROQUDRAFT_87660 [Cronartium quercuum f. sp. fusiforme G11]